MMKTRDQIALLLVSLIALMLIESSSAIICWDCDTLTNEHCGDPFNNSTISPTNCLQIAEIHQQLCRKIIHPNNRIIRGCLIDDQSRQQLDEATINLCSDDGCNTATNHLPVMAVLIAVPAILAACNLF